MNIIFLKEDSLELLKKRDILSNIKCYGNENNTWLGLKYKDYKLFAEYDKKTFNDFNLIKSDNPDDDFENMKIMYDNLKDLTDSQASDERIWSGLAHYQFWDYMQERWPLPEKKDKQNAHVLNNYFFWNSTKAVFLNGLSRLWWYARYTYEPNNSDPYELTKYICTHDLNGKIFPLVSCKFAVNKDVFKNIIRIIKEYEEENEFILSRSQFNEIKKYLNRLSGKIVIDLLTYDELKEKIIKKLNTIIKIKQTI